ncbi:Elongator complex protein 3 [Hondaea fermentalgiana]|uniref:tRNA carboxymethyluridine synthase n=1 Tax=Hondaea fermentalgiana TaxID=2315210 RepID=A0A2R5G3A1_9STRA|nr:Elongator complex protein 3 [Hondaea fermentalgiana]|eukprot:GBG25517.1 Elongator complex protein 3 [Hondaea fermentalgiana]
MSAGRSASRGEDLDGRVVLHVDVDGFYCACEARRRPELRGKPVAVTQFNSGGFVALNEEASRAGLRKGDGIGAQGHRNLRFFKDRPDATMEGVMRKCPDLTILPMDTDWYRTCSEDLLDALASFRSTLVVEKSSIDDFFIEATAHVDLHCDDDHSWDTRLVYLWAPGDQTSNQRTAADMSPRAAAACSLAADLRAHVRETLGGMTISVGIGPNKLLARLVSKRKLTPDSQTIIFASMATALAQSTALKSVPGLKGKLGSQIQEAFGVEKLADLNIISDADLARSVPDGRASQDPEDYKKTPAERFTFNEDLEDIYKTWKQLVPDEKRGHAEIFVKELIALNPQTNEELNKATSKVRRMHKFPCSFRKSELLHVLMALEEEGKLSGPEVVSMRKLLVKKSGKSNSGVLVITVLTSPYPHGQKFSCEWNCYYCPNEPDQPRSYLHDEPSVLRANRNRFDPVLQFFDRAVTLAMNGHPVDKIELLILGGTWASYPVSYQEEFIRDLFFAANTFYTQGTGRDRKSLSEEKALNERARCKIIGITLETRPDCINAQELQRFRRYGCTRVQLGVQHTDNAILKRINRGCTSEDVRNALRLLKDACYKVDIHLMPNLPGSTPDVDRKMFDEVLTDPDFQADQWKIYPCETTPWTVIQRWYETGKYKPYPEDELMDVLLETKAKVHPWIRLNRVIRDIPSQYILGGVDNPSLRQVLQKRLLANGQRCRCIRCREVRNQTPSPDDVSLVVRSYEGQGAQEFFLSYEVNDEAETILGFLRLRLPGRRVLLREGGVESALPPSLSSASVTGYSSDDDEEDGEDGGGGDNDDESEAEDRGRSTVNAATSVSSSGGGLRRRKRSKTPTVRRQTPAKKSAAKTPSTTSSSAKPPRVDPSQMFVPFSELDGAALVRELHVYGQLIPTEQSKRTHAQHTGIGTRLMAEAEKIAQRHWYRRVAVISGVGVRDYYRKLGYELQGEGEFMMKELSPVSEHVDKFILALMAMIVGFNVFLSVLVLQSLQSSPSPLQ